MVYFSKKISFLWKYLRYLFWEKKKSVTRYFPTAEEKLIHRDFPSFPASHKIRGGRRRAKTIARTTIGGVDSFLFSSFSAKGLRKGEDFQPRRREGERQGGGACCANNYFSLPVHRAKKP